MSDRSVLTRLRAIPRRTPLRVRLVVALLALVALALVVTGVVATTALHGYLVQQVDRDLTAGGPDLGGPPAGGDDESPFRSGRAEWLRFTSLDVARLGPATLTGPATSPPVVTRAMIRSAAVEGRAFTVRSRDGASDWRVAVQPERFRGVGPVLQVRAISLRDVDNTVHRLVVIETMVGALVLLLLGAAGYFVVRSNLKPLVEVERTAESIAGGDLTQRVREHDPRTEVGRLARALNGMLAQIESAFRSREASEAAARASEERMRRFVADASHELRTPLATIRAYSEYATRADRALPDPAQQAFDRIDAAAIRMTHLVDDLLLLARLDAGRPLAREPVDLTQVVVEAVADVRAAGPGHRWRLDLPDEPVPVIGDPHRLHQLVLNLLANARAHTPDGTTVTATLIVVHGVIRIEVADDGPGIPAEQQEAIFDRFTRLDESRGHPTRSDDSGSSSHASSGLGLAIARGIAVAHSATLSVRSRPGRTVFTIEMPDRQSDERSDGQADGQADAEGDLPDTPLDPI
ncbi:MAG: two-component system, OmpR family, sensor kinase [Actinomycetota bacterium]|nr:two-component system, OmpR family, sensor kinase [Actinomycetota bacterium]